MVGDCNAKYSSWSISDTTALKGTQLDYHIFIQGLEVWSHCDPGAKTLVNLQNLA